MNGTLRQSLLAQQTESKPLPGAYSGKLEDGQAIGFLVHLLGYEYYTSVVDMTRKTKLPEGFYTVINDGSTPVSVEYQMVKGRRGKKGRLMSNDLVVLERRTQDKKAGQRIAFIKP